MLAVYREYPMLEFASLAAALPESSAEVPQPVALFTPEVVLALPWGHHAIMMEKVKDAATRQCYMHANSAGRLTIIMCKPC
jgi:hypothetical protein